MGPSVRYDPTATIGAPAPTAVARVTGKPEIEYRGAEKIQTAMKQTLEYEVNPQTSLVDGGNIEFFYPGTDCYVDLNNTYMLLQLKLVKADGSAVAAWDETTKTNNFTPGEEATTAVINYLPATMWKSVSTEVGGVVVTKPHNYYAYNAYVDAMLAYTKEYKGTRLGMSVVSDPDTFVTYGAVVDSIANPTFTATMHNRSKPFDVSNTVQVIAPVLHVNVCEQPLALPPRVPIKFTFVPNPGAFCVKATAVTAADGTNAAKIKDAAVTGNYKIQIVQAKLFFKLYQVDEMLDTILESGMISNPIAIPLRSVDIKSQIVTKGVASAEITICNGKWPRRVIVGFVRNDAVNGAYRQNPFYFNHMNINYIALRAGSTTFPKVPFTPDFANNMYCREYLTFQTACFPSGSLATNGITPEQFKNGSCLFVFDVTPDQDSADTHVSTPKSGALVLVIKTAQNVDTDYNAICLLEYDEILNIGGPRMVTLTQ
jgi:hypothetical protein